MRISGQTKPRGIALFIVMIAIFVLSVMAAIFAASIKVETKLAMNAEHEQEMLWLGRSGVELARYVLAQQLTIPGEPYDALNQIWAGGPGGPGESNSPLSSINLNDYQIGDGTVSVKIIDLERLANINAAPPQMIQRALNLMGVNADGISVISDSILDWVSPGENPRLAGAKSDYYQSLDPPYYCKDAPMDSLSELLLVRGIRNHPEIYWGGSATNYHPAAFQQRLNLVNSPFDMPEYLFGLKDIFTPISDGRININTANANVLQVALGVNAATAENIIKYRAGPDGVEGTADDTPFANPGLQLIQAGVPPPVIQRDGRFLTTRSVTFAVHVTARIGDYQREYVAVLLRRSPTDIRILSFYWK